jgi:hypothetical protein
LILILLPINVGLREFQDCDSVSLKCMALALLLPTAEMVFPDTKVRTDYARSKIFTLDSYVGEQGSICQEGSKKSLKLRSRFGGKKKSAIEIDSMNMIMDHDTPRRRRCSTRLTSEKGIPVVVISHFILEASSCG